METLRQIVSIQFCVFEIAGYGLSAIELLGVCSGLGSVYLASRMNRHTWSLGLINEAAFIVIFYQVQLYSDMLLQIFFAAVTLYGWVCWKKPDDGCERAPLRPFSIKRLHQCIAVILLGTVGLGALMSEVHTLLPGLSLAPAAYPYQDGFTAAASIVATTLLARRAVETWLLWIGVDLVSIPLYFARSIPFMGMLYVLFLVLAVRGLLSWLQAIGYEARTRVR